MPLSLLALLACGGETLDEPADTADTATTGLADADLHGEWTTGCYDAGYGNWALNTLSYAGEGATYEYWQYEGDATCTNAAVLLVYGYTSDREWILGAALDGYSELDMVREAPATYTIYTQAAADGWNASSGCGPFAVGVATDVGGQTCWGWYQPEAGEAQYNIVGLPDGLLTFGDPATGDMRTEASRPTALQGISYHEE